MRIQQTQNQPHFQAIRFANVKTQTDVKALETLTGEANRTIAKRVPYVPIYDTLTKKGSAVENFMLEKFAEMQKHNLISKDVTAISVAD